MTPAEPAHKLSLAKRWMTRCFEPIDIASLVYFRITFGALMVWEMWRFLVGPRVANLLVQPEFEFKYLGFGWVQPPPSNSIHLLFAVLFTSAAGVTIGLCYRLCALIFAVCFTWLFLIDAAQYLNHFYLICLIGFVSVLLPANRRLAVDSLLKPSLRSDIAPAWTLWLLRAQVAVVYFYGGVAKLNMDWLRGEPMRTWLARDAEDSKFESLFRSEWTVGFVCYGGLLFDLLIVPLMLWRKTRVITFLLAVGFHLSNNFLFQIGVFPWMGIAVTALFFRPDWPRRFATHLRSLWTGGRKVARAALINREQFGFQHRRLILTFLGLYLSWQLLMPLRHFLYPGAVSWTEEGHRFSWHMKLRTKSGDAGFFVLDPATKEVWTVDSYAYLTPRQQRKMVGHPDMLLQFGHYIARQMAARGRTNLQVYVIAHAELNARQPALLIDPDVNLVTVRRSLWPASWILPLENTRPVPERFASEFPRSGFELEEP